MIAGINDLATLEPLLVKQWSKKNKIKPTEVSIGSIVLSFGDTNDERIEEAVDELRERRLQE